MSSTLPVPDVDEQRRKLTMATALLDRIADHLERLDRNATLAPEQRAAVDAALELALIAREELDPMVVSGVRPSLPSSALGVSRAVDGLREASEGRRPRATVCSGRRAIVDRRALIPGARLTFVCPERSLPSRISLVSTPTSPSGCLGRSAPPSSIRGCATRRRTRHACCSLRRSASRRRRASRSGSPDCPASSTAGSPLTSSTGPRRTRRPLSQR
jgi:hypothetical protein